MAHRRRSKKTTPAKELIFLLTIAGVFTAFQLRTSFKNITPYFWALLLVAIIASAGMYMFLVWKQRMKLAAMRALDLSHIDDMPGVEFEKYVAALLNHQDYKTKMTRWSGDYGVDIIATKDGMRTAVQVKRYSKPLDQKAVREAVAGKTVREYNCTQAMVVTNNTFTKAARFLANENDCKLVDREVLAEWILAFQKSKSKPGAESLLQP